MNLNKEILSDKNWHSLKADEVVKIFGSDKSQGLSEEEAQKRIEMFGPNELTKTKSRR